MPMPVSPSPSQSPTTGLVPVQPNWNVMSGVPALALSRSFQVNVLGSIMPMPLWPWLAQSPTTGIVFAPPYWMGRSSAPAALVLRRCHVAVVERIGQQPARRLGADVLAAVVARHGRAQRVLGDRPGG